MRKVHPPDKEPELFACGICERAFKSQYDLRDHRKADHLTPSAFSVMANAHNGCAMHYRYFFDTDILTIDDGADKAETEIVSLLKSQLVDRKLLKCNVIMFVEMYKTDEEDQVSRMETFPFHATAFMARPFVSLNRLVADALDEIQAMIGEFCYEVRDYFFFKKNNFN